MKTGWKVMRRVGGRLASALAGSQRTRGWIGKHNGNRMYYYVRKPAKASWRKPLTVFTSRRDALRWAATWVGDGKGLEVWQCSYEPCDKPKWVSHLWRGPPEGTAFATTLRLGDRRDAVVLSGVGGR